DPGADPDHVRPRRLRLRRAAGRRERVHAQGRAAGGDRGRGPHLASGDALFAPAVTRAVIEEFSRIPVRAQPACRAAVGELTPREREVVALLTRGAVTPETCRELVISEATAKTHVAKILMKLGLRDRVQAVIYAARPASYHPAPPPNPAAK